MNSFDKEKSPSATDSTTSLVTQAGRPVNPSMTNAVTFEQIINQQFIDPGTAPGVNLQSKSEKQDPVRQTTQSSETAPVPLVQQPKTRINESVLMHIGPYLKLMRRTYLDTPKVEPEIFVRKTIVEFQRSQRELEHLLAKSQHPNIIRYVRALKHSDGTIEIDMEHADAGQIDAVMKRVHPDHLIVTAKCVARQLFCGLFYYYEVHGRCHHDIKPSTIVVRSDGTAKVCSFDSAHNSSIRTEPHRIHGNRSFSAPETMIHHWSVNDMIPFIDGEKADVWSAALAVFSLVIDRNPLELINIGPFEAPTQIHVENLPWKGIADKPLEHLLRRCLKVNVNERATHAEACAITFVVQNEGPNADKDPWFEGFADPSDKFAQRATKEFKIQLCDDQVRQTCCPFTSEDVASKVAIAIEAMRAELQAWKQVRERSDTARETVDPVMKEVTKLRCKRTRVILREVARLKEIMLQSAALLTGGSAVAVAARA